VSRILVVAPLALLIGACENIVDLRMQAEQLCVLASRESFEGSSAPSGPLPIPGASNTPVKMSFDRPLAQVPGAVAGFDLDVRFDEVLIKSATDLSFIRRVRVSVEPGTPKDTLPPIPIGEFVRDGASTGPTNEIKVSSKLEANVFKYLVDEPARLRFAVSGRLPMDAFTADVEACVFVQSQVTF
jgi:hypothetical protein